MAAARARSVASDILILHRRASAVGAPARHFQIARHDWMVAGQRKERHNDPEKLAGTDQAEQDRVLVEGQDPDHARRRAARARLRPDARQRAAPRAAVVAARRCRDRRPDRRRAARVLLDRRRARGRDRHRAQHQGNRHQDGRRRPQAHGRAQAGSGRRHRRRHPDGRRRRDPEPRPRDLHARRGRGDPHGVHRRHRQGLCAGRPQPRRGRADRPDPGRQPLFAGQEGLLQGREHPRGPGSRL